MQTQIVLLYKSKQKDSTDIYDLDNILVLTFGFSLIQIIMAKESILKALILALAIIITGALLGNAFKKRNANLDTISSIGLGTKEFTSDEIFFSGSYTSKAMDAKKAYAMIIADKEKVKNFFKSKGFKENEFSFSGVNFEKSYRNITTESGENRTQTQQVFDGYIAKQTISLSSKKNPDLMKRIEEVTDKTSELINSGVEFNPDPIQYKYSDLPSLKRDLIEKATKDAKERAEKIVETANGNLGKLKTAYMGVFQITGEGTVEEDTYGGNNDIYHKQKFARVTVRLQYELE